MIYNYETEREGLLHPKNTAKIVRATQEVLRRLEKSGAVTCKAVQPGFGTNWQDWAFLQWMAEEGMLRRVVQEQHDIAGCYEVYVAPILH